MRDTMKEFYADFPFPTPRLIKAYARKEKCYRCHAWVDRYPSFMGDRDDFWECERCGCTSMYIEDARPYGPNSRKWFQVCEWWEDLWRDLPPWDFDTVECDPPLSSIDWSVVADWYEERGITHIYIGAPIMDITKDGDNEYSVVIHESGSIVDREGNSL